MLPKKAADQGPTRKQPPRGVKAGGKRKRSKSSTSDSSSPLSSPPDSPGLQNGPSVPPSDPSTSKKKKTWQSRLYSFEVPGPWPEDIIEVMMKELFYTDFDSFVNCLSSCKQWHNIGHLIPWLNIRVDETNIDLVREALSRAEEEHIRSITLFLYELDSFEAVSISRFLVRMAKLPNLESTSVTGSFRDHEDGPGLALNRLCAVLEAIPNTVRYLELRDFGLCDGRLNHDNHTCLAIRRLLPQLKALRLNSSRCCKEIFAVRGQSPLLLEGVDIDMLPYVSHAWCDPADSVVPEGLFDAGRALLDQGRLPQIKHFVICGRPIDEAPAPRDIGIFYILNVLRNYQKCFPTSMTTEKLWVRYSRNPDADIWDMMVTGDDPEATFVDCCQNDHWVTTVRRYRLPFQLVSQLRMRYIRSPRLGVLRQNFRNHIAAHPDDVKLWYFDRVLNKLLVVPHHLSTSNNLHTAMHCTNAEHDEIDRAETELQHLAAVARRPWV